MNMNILINRMFDPLQPVYRYTISTETALIKVQNDILSAFDAGHFADVGSLCFVRHTRSRYLAVRFM